MENERNQDQGPASDERSREPAEDRIEELARLRESASDRFAGRVTRAVDRVETAAHIGDFSGGVLTRTLLEMASLLLGLIAVKDKPRTERSE